MKLTTYGGSLSWLIRKLTYTLLFVDYLEKCFSLVKYKKINMHLIFFTSPLNNYSKNDILFLKRVSNNFSHSVILINQSFLYICMNLQTMLKVQFWKYLKTELLSMCYVLSETNITNVYIGNYIWNIVIL